LRREALSVADWARVGPDAVCIEVGAEAGATIAGLASSPVATANSPEAEGTSGGFVGASKIVAATFAEEAGAAPVAPELDGLERRRG
jgi:hypothetical protein